VILAAISGVLLFGELLGPPAQNGSPAWAPARFMAGLAKTRPIMLQTKPCFFAPPPPERISDFRLPPKLEYSILNQIENRDTNACRLSAATKGLYSRPPPSTTTASPRVIGSETIQRSVKPRNKVSRPSHAPEPKPTTNKSRIVTGYRKERKVLSRKWLEL
jgi:hypothetical protein